MKTVTVQLGEVMTIDRTTASHAECRTLPYVGLEHIEKDTGNFAADFRRESETLLATKFRFTRAHVLYGKLRPNLNKVTLPDFDGVCSTEIFPLLPRPQMLDRRYLYAVLLSRRFVKWASNSVSGANLPRLDPERLREYEVKLPDFPEQQRVAERLQQADQLRRTRRYALELTDTFLPAAFLELFGDPATNPLGLPVTELGDFLSFVTSGSRGWADYYVPEGARFIRSLDVRMNNITDEDAVFVKPPNGAEADRTRVKPADVLLTITGSRIGRVAPVPERLNGAFISQHVAILRLKAGLLPEFLSMFLSLDTGGQREIARAQYGQTKPGLNLDQIREFRVPVPHLCRQQQFLELVKRVERQRAVQREALRQAEHLFASLLHRTFSG
jgi:type I restriction enzyme S subunit